jgi:hypothetical protein
LPFELTEQASNAAAAAGERERNATAWVVEVASALIAVVAGGNNSTSGNLLKIAESCILRRSGGPFGPNVPMAPKEATKAPKAVRGRQGLHCGSCKSLFDPDSKRSCKTTSSTTVGRYEMKAL